MIQRGIHGIMGMLCAAKLLADPISVAAQAGAERSVRASVDTFFALITRQKWDPAASMIDLARFEPFFKGAVRNARSAIPQPPMTVERLMALDSTMPKAVAAWQVGEARRRDG